MRALVSPKDLARAIGVSESSMKRWADSGLVTVSRTVGGHRRIALPEAVRFIRQIGATVVRPDVLGLTDLASLPRDWSGTVGRGSNEAFHVALERGEAATARGMIQSLYLGGMSIAQISDGPIRQAMNSIGELWLHQEWGIAVEHRASDICIQAINQLRFLQPPSIEDAPIALGGAIEKDPYLLPSLMAAAVAGESGFRDVNLGPRTPISTLRTAAEHYRADLVWAAISVVEDAARTTESLASCSAFLAGRGIPMFAGGRMMGELPMGALPNIRFVGSMVEFGELAVARFKTLRPNAALPARPEPGKNGDHAHDQANGHHTT